MVAGCSLIDGGVSGEWASRNGLSVDLKMDRSWTGTYNAGFSDVEITGRWDIVDNRVSLTPLTWKSHSPFSSGGPSQKSMARSVADRLANSLKEKVFIAGKDGELQVLRDTNPSNNMTMYRVVE